MSIESRADSRHYVCECNRWLDKREEDGRIERELDAVSLESQPAEEVDIRQRQSPRRLTASDAFDDEERAALARMTQATRQRPTQKCVYSIRVRTSDVRNAGTDANVYVHIFGREADTGRLPLVASKTHKDKFERGNVDVFDIEAIDVGQIERIR